MLLPQTLTAAIALTMFAVIAFRMEANTEGFVFSFFSLFAWIALVSEFFLLYDSIIDKWLSKDRSVIAATWFLLSLLLSFMLTPDKHLDWSTAIVMLSNSGNSDKNHPELYDMTSRYYINGNTTETTKGQKTENKDWKGVSYDKGVPSLNGEYYSPDANNFYGDAVAHTTISGKSCVKIKMDKPAPTGQVTTHSAAEAYEKVLAYVGASLYRDEIDARYMEEAKTGTAIYKGSITNSPGIIDKVSDVNGYTEANFGTASRPADFDTDKDGIPDSWETANGLDPNDATDALTYSLDSKEYYTNLEVYANSLVEDIMKQGNADAENKVDEYYPAWKNPTGILQITGSNPSELVKVTYYSLNGTLLSAPQKGINIRKMLFKNGKTIVDKVIKE